MRVGWQKPGVGARINWGDPLARGLVGCWLMNEGGGDRVHDLTGNLHGTLTNMEPVDWVSSEMGSALAFGGTDEYGLINYAPVMTRLSDAITVVAWLRIGNLSATGAVIGRYVTSGNHRCFRLGLDSSEQMTGFISPDGTTYGQWPTSTTISQNVWHQCAWVKLPSSGTCNNYVDDTLNNSGVLGGSVTSIYPSTSAYMTIGMGYNLTGEPFIGDLASVMVYDRALSASEVAQLYATPYRFVRWGWDPLLWYVDAAGGGEQLTITRAVALSGAETQTVSRSLALLGAESATIARALALLGSDPQTVARAAELSGLESATLTRALEISGADSQTISRAAELIGADPQTIARGLILLGSEGQTVARALALIGSIEATLTRAAEAYGSEASTIARALDLQGSEAATIARACELWGVLAGSEAVTVPIAAYAYQAMTVARDIAFSASEALSLTRSLGIWGSEPTSLARAANLWGAGAVVTRDRPARARILTSGYTIRAAG